MRLGEILTNRGLIDDRQLSEALEAQVIYGGHLGTCLIELGAIDERQLGEVLAEVSGLEVAGPDVFRDIPLWVIESIPARLAEKHQVVPFHRHDRNLDVALIDPKDLRVLDELAFASGCKIKAWVAPEVRIFQALERYYDVPRRLRYVQLCRQLDSGSANLSLVHGLEAQEQVLKLARSAAQTLATADASAPASAALSGDDAPTEASTLDELDGEIERVTELLCRVKSEDQVAGLALEFVMQGVERSLLFAVKSAEASIWRSRGFDRPLEANGAPSFSITGEPLFGLLLGNTHYRGPLPEGGPFHRFYEALAVEPPGELLLIPIHVEDRLVAMFYGDSAERGGIRGQTETFCRLIRKTGLALHLARIKQRLRAI